MRLRFGMSSVVFLALVLLTGVLWIGFEFYHKKTDIEIPVKLRAQATTPLPDSFDSETLKTLYEKGKDKFNESPENETQTNGQF
jgi:hypothetical protein